MDFFQCFHNILEISFKKRFHAGIVYVDDFDFISEYKTDLSMPQTFGKTKLIILRIFKHQLLMMSECIANVGIITKAS